MRYLLTLATLLMVLWGNSSIAQQSETKLANLVELKQKRKEAAHRRRRIIFNNDGNDYQCPGPPTVENFLKCRTTPLLGSHVDSIFYCCVEGLIAHHNSKEAEVLPLKEGFSEKYPNLADDLIRQGTDTLEVMVDFCRKHDIEVFCSYRMNDTHDVGNSDIVARWKKDHPGCLLGSEQQRPRHGQWTALDYGRPEVRDKVFRILQEICQGYAVDGVELDFFRHPVFFKRHAAGRDCGQEERDMMTRLMRRVRKMTEQAGLTRGRPILIAIRVPDSIGYCSAIGLDIVRWLEEDLVDILVPGGYYRFSPWQVTVELGHKYNVPVYPCLSESRTRYHGLDRGEAASVRNSLEGYRARAMNVWDAGADGVYIFNFFNPLSPLWRELGDRESLQTMDKVYTTGARGIATIESGWIGLTGGERFLNRPTFGPERPLQLEPGRSVEVVLRAGQHVREDKARRLLPEVKLRLRVSGLAEADDLAVKINGNSLADRTKTGAWLEYPVRAGLVTKGTNRFDIAIKATSARKPVLDDLLLWVRYK